MTGYEVRAYAASDLDAWLRCRLLSFFGTQYYDDVVVERPAYPEPALYLVAAHADGVAGILDVSVDGRASTIETVAVHSDHARRGLATRLLETALPRLAGLGVRTLDAWTRGDEAANAWYQARGFRENFRYLHVYKESDEPDDGFVSPSGLSAPVRAFCHARLEHRAELTARYRRVYECRQYLRDVP